MAKVNYLTKQGLKDLQDELDKLKTEKRKEIAEKIKIARSFGDLSENSEYDEALNDQAKIESRIAEIEMTLKNYELINEDDTSSDIIKIGTKFKILDLEFNEKMDFKMVGSAEADPMKGRVSDESPIGKAVIGHKVGDKVVAITPGGEVNYEIIEIH